MYYLLQKSVLGEWALSMVGVEEGREFRFRGDLYFQENTFPLVVYAFVFSEVMVSICVAFCAILLAVLDDVIVHELCNV